MLCDITHEVEISKDAASVYRAISTREGQAGAWTANNTLEPRVGTVAEFRFKSAPVPLRMRVDELQEGRAVRMTCLGEFPGWKDTTVSWELGPSSEGKGTKVLFRHGNLEGAGYPEAALASVNYTWGQVLGRLKTFVETGRPQPFLE
ncbi:MAG: SRPBCC family protein [Candidatus Limnocylindria bacterium]